MNIKNCYTDLSELTKEEIKKLAIWLEDKFLLDSRLSKSEFDSLKIGEIDEYHHLGFEDDNNKLWLSDYSDQEPPVYKKLDLKTFVKKYEKQINGLSR